MEFKFRATDKQASPQIPASSGIGYFTEQALRARYSIPDLGHSTSITDLGRSTEVLRRPAYLSEAIQRELEKDQIREEIIAAEIARRRMLEAEVRRELWLEREVALRRGEGFSLFSASAFRFEGRLSLLHGFEDRSLEERLALSLEERLACQGRPSFGGFETLPFQRNAEPKISEAKPPPEVSKEKVISLPRLEGNLSGTKRKAVTPPATGSSELPTVGLKKKLKEEWSCALCQVSATSEQGLDDHLRGKKHKAREAALIGQRSGKNYTIGLLPKKAGKPVVKLAESTNNRNFEQEKQPGNEPQQVKQNNDLALEAIEKSNESSKKNGDSARRMRKNGDHKKKKRFKFWCEMCQAGAYYEKVMNAHKNGKKHAARLLELNKNGGMAAQGEEEASKNDKDHEVVVKDEKGAPDNVYKPSEDGEALENHRAAED